LTFSSPNDIIKSTHAIDAKGGRLPIGTPGRLQIGMHGRLRRYPQIGETGPKAQRNSITFDPLILGRETNVRCWGKSGRHLLMLSVSQFDPKADSTDTPREGGRFKPD